jgi:hypothetical protein
MSRLKEIANKYATGEEAICSGEKVTSGKDKGRYEPSKPKENPKSSRCNNNNNNKHKNGEVVATLSRPLSEAIIMGAVVLVR